MVLSEDQIDAYLARIGARRPARPDPEALASLQRSHLDRVPFENLDIHLGVVIDLDEARIVDKLVRRRRGGFCYELNGAFAVLLEGLGYQVDRLEARVFDGDRLGIPFDHLVLRVHADGPWLVDVGFGASHRNPLRMDRRDDQDDPAGTFRLADAEGGAVDLLTDGRPQFRVDPTVRVLQDFAPGCRHHQTSPESHFTQATVCSRPTPEGGRVTIRDTTLITTTHEGARTEVEVQAGELPALYRELFGMDLPHPPTGPAARPRS